MFVQDIGSGLTFGDDVEENFSASAYRKQGKPKDYKMS
jgi:hypothetical protein